jgi:hypothetical protein
VLVDNGNFDAYWASTSNPSTSVSTPTSTAGGSFTA